MQRLDLKEKFYGSVGKMRMRDAVMYVTYIRLPCLVFVLGSSL
jgi:hypothetical protein